MKDIAVQGLYVNSGRISHSCPAQLSDSELLSLAQLQGLPLCYQIDVEIEDRGLRPELCELFAAERMVPNH